MKLKIFLSLLGFCLAFQSSFAQEDLEKLKSQILNIKMPLPWIIKSDSSKIIFLMTDTMRFCGRYDISPLNDFDTLALNTYTLELTLENDWSKKRVKRTQKKIDEITRYLKNRVIRYGDSLNWEMPKTNKRAILENPMWYLYIVRNWTVSEEEMIHQIGWLPNSIIKGVGVFVQANTRCVMPERKNKSLTELHSKLNDLGIDIPGSKPEKIDKGKEEY